MKILRHSFLVSGSVALLLVAMNTFASSPIWLTADAVDESALVRGEQIALEGTGGIDSCVNCHGRYGDDSLPQGIPVISGQPAAYLAKQLLDYQIGLRSHEIMSPFSQQLSEDDVLAVSAWFSSQEVVNYPFEDPDMKKVARGSTLFVVGDLELRVESCANCHGTRGEGLAPTLPRIAGQSSDYIINQFNSWKNETRNSESAIIMQRITAKLSDDDIESLAVFLESYVQPPE